MCVRNAGADMDRNRIPPAIVAISYELYNKIYCTLIYFRQCSFPCSVLECETEVPSIHFRFMSDQRPGRQCHVRIKLFTHLRTVSVLLQNVSEHSVRDGLFVWCEYDSFPLEKWLCSFWCYEACSTETRLEIVLVEWVKAIKNSPYGRWVGVPLTHQPMNTFPK
jgi:hypothetical protein